LRGETQEVLLFDAEGIALSVNLEQEDTGAYTLYGQVLSEATVPAAGGYARLTGHTEDAAAIQSPLDANRSFALSDLRPGLYQLLIHLPDQTIIVPTLSLKEEL
jgi:hypothetical protein